MRFDMHMLPEENYRSTTDTATRRRLQAAVVAAQRSRVAEAAREMVPPEHRAEAEQVGLIGVLLALEEHAPETGRPFRLGALDMAKAEIRAWLDAGTHYRKRAAAPESQWRVNCASAIVCTLPCLRLIGQLLPTGHDWKMHRQAEEIATLAIMAARDSYEHREGRKFWQHAKPYVAKAIKAWIAQGMPIKLEWLN
jgi:hypothetical protein